MRETIEAFSKYLQRQEKSKNTVEKYVRDVRKFFLKGLGIPHQISQVEDVVRALQTHHILHIGYIPMRIGKNQQLHAITFQPKHI